MMVGILKAKVSTFEFAPEDIQTLIAQDLKVDPSKIKVQFVIEEVGGDPMDRFRGVDKVTKIRVTKTED